MSSVLVCLAVVLSSSLNALPDSAGGTRGISLSDSGKVRAASLLQGASLASSWKPSRSEPLRLTDPLRLDRSALPLPLDEGGGVSSDTRQILALILGFVPGFGIGHLVAGDKNGFVLFLIVDVALYVTWSVIGSVVWRPFWGVGALVWLVVHIFQALDAYHEAGGEKIVEQLRQRALEIASGGSRGGDGPVTTTRVWSFSF